MVLAGIELIFFIVDCMVLCFGFVMKTLLTMQGCFLLSSAHAVVVFSVFHTASPARRLGVHKKLVGNKARTADPD